MRARTKGGIADIKNLMTAVDKEWTYTNDRMTAFYTITTQDTSQQQEKNKSGKEMTGEEEKTGWIHLCRLPFFRSGMMNLLRPEGIQNEGAEDSFDSSCVFKGNYK